MKKKIVSIIGAGLLTYSIAAPQAYAESNSLQTDLNYQKIRQQISHPCKPAFDPFKRVQIPGFSKTSAITKSDTDYDVEDEPNDYENNANRISFNRMMLGNLPYYDFDVYALKVTKPGLVLVGGMTESPNIDLIHALFTKDMGNDPSKFKYLGLERDESAGITVMAYRVYKPGTYFIYVADADNQYGYDNNTPEDIYGIMAFWEDITPPAAPKVKKVDDNDKSVKGTAEAGSTVTVKAGSKTLGSSKANSKGAFSVTIKPQKYKTTLTVTAKDKAGNVSKKATVRVAKH
ncbi:Ig-like domain-containing protein [Peribacillus glennii]|uniref:Bacterial Ig domain-containing protein n=1 Tax=Peribacillus glennii TaxID=2303991 RepID=A0A372L7S4_9BACI|nr:Ig-like domain-containing protein [Peribacillus glennii]RFU60803.1 hypothetical protein D0466_20860 [Peribacillus glennii]